MKLVSWNVNGIRAVAKKGLEDIMAQIEHDVFCFQETKAQVEQVKDVLQFTEGASVTANEAQRKGYSGTAICSKTTPNSTHIGIGIEEHDQEGRVVTHVYDQFTLVNVYTPNSGNGLARIDYRQSWDEAFSDYVRDLRKASPVIICGDLNVCHKAIDLARPKPNYNKSAGFTQTEIDGLELVMGNEFIDSFRSLHPDEVKYSWWSYRAGARGKNIGWRIDYFLVDKRLEKNIVKAEILNEVMGSDHCPVLLELQF